MRVCDPIEKVLFLKDFYKESKTLINSQIDIRDIKDIVFDYLVYDCSYEVSSYGSGLASICREIDGREYNNPYYSIWFSEDNSSISDIDYRYKCALGTKESGGVYYSVSRFIVSCPTNVDIKYFKSQVISNILNRLDLEYQGSIFSIKEQSQYSGKIYPKFYLFIYVPLK